MVCLTIITPTLWTNSWHCTYISLLHIPTTYYLYIYYLHIPTTLPSLRISFCQTNCKRFPRPTQFCDKFLASFFANCWTYWRYHITVWLSMIDNEIWLWMIGNELQRYSFECFHDNEMYTMVYGVSDWSITTNAMKINISSFWWVDSESYSWQIYTKVWKWFAWYGNRKHTTQNHIHFDAARMPKTF